VAHVRADSWGNLGFGQGYACATDYGPTILDQITKVRGERARVFGPGNGNMHLDSDVGYLAIGLRRDAPVAMQSQPAHIRELVEGYAAGVRAWLAETEPSQLPSWCPTPEAIGTVEAADLFAYFADLTLAAGTRNLIRLIGTAAPPGPDGPVPAPELPQVNNGMGSNAWAVGRAASATGNGMVLANPHFPWYGEVRFWECHLVLPGELDVYGISLVGTPGVQMGFNRNLAWAHTFSVGSRFTVYRLDLAVGEPTKYHYGDDIREMAESSVTVGVLGESGGIEEVTRSVWSSHYGPMLNLPLLGWSEQWGFTFRDANSGNDKFLAQFLGMDAAGDLDEFRRVFETENGIPWVNTLAADTHGNVWYIDASRTPALSTAGEAWLRDRLVDDPLVRLLFDNKVAMLDGSDPTCEWEDRPGSPAAGVVPFADLPQLSRDDYVANANESHWLTNPARPLEGFSRLHGVEGAPPSPRTRANLAAVTAPGSGRDEKLTAADLEERIFSNRSVTAQLACSDLAARCRSVGVVKVGERTIDLVAVADVLDAWDRSFDIASQGAAIWRETMASLPDDALRAPGILWDDSFTLEEPLRGPRTLAPPPDGGPDLLVEAVARAVVALEGAGVPIDAPLGEIQFAVRGGLRIGVHGGQERDGTANILGPLGLFPSSSLEPLALLADPVDGRSDLTGLRAGGYSVTYGTAFVMIAELTAAGPRARGLMAYGQYGDTSSDAATEPVVAYAEKRLRPLLFDEADILADPNLVVRRITSWSVTK
jgi:acyl-homoserine-lactone acylase